MAKVQQKNKYESFDQMFRRFKRLVDEEKIIQEARERKHYEKPSVRRKLEKAAACKRHQRKVQTEKNARLRQY